MDAERFFEARTAYQDGLQRYHGGALRGAGDEVAETFESRIATANLSLAQLNVREAEYAATHGSTSKAIEHLELAKSLTEDVALREMADNLLHSLVEKTNDTSELEPVAAGCGSCSSAHPEIQADDGHSAREMSPQDYYDLLIRQLPGELYQRYTGLGEEFACMYLAESRDEHQKALGLIEQWHYGADADIYWYEKGMILYRVGKAREAETCLRKAFVQNDFNPLPPLGLSLLLVDVGRLDEAADQLDEMISRGMLVEQALMLRGDVSLLAGDQEGAIDIFSRLLVTPLARQAAEKLHGLLVQCGRQQDATVVFKKYLKGCCH